MLYSLARTIRNDSLTLSRSAENRNTSRFHHVAGEAVELWWFCTNDL